MRRLATVFVLGAFWFGCGDGGGEGDEPDARGDGDADGDAAPPAGPIEYEVERYDYRIDLATRAARSEVSLRAVTAGDCVAIPFRAAVVGDVELGGAAARSAEVDGGQLVACGAGWDAGAELILALDLEVPAETLGDTQVGFSVTVDLEGAPFTYLVSWVGGCDRFGPCDAAPDRFARYRFEVAHPQGTHVLCPGVITAGDTSTVCEFEHDGGPTYSTFGIAASPSWERIDLGDWGGVRAWLYDAPSTGAAEAFDADTHAAFLAWMSERFGPYPYGDEIRFATGPTYWSGFEHPGNILLYDRLHLEMSSYADALVHVTNHEIAHQWAGDETTLADTYDFVWKEAMAEYLAFVFEDEAIDPAVARATAFAWKSFSRFAAYYPVPAEEPPLVDYYGDVYGPGPMILFRQIEALFDRAAVMEALASLLGEERAISVADVQAALEASTGADLDGYFDAWVYGEGDPIWPTVDIAVAQTGSGPVELTVTQVTGGAPPYGCAFAVRLIGDGAEQTHDVWIDFGVDGAASVTAMAEPGFAVTDHQVDPLAHTLVREAVPSAAPPWIPEPDPRVPWARR
jgi:aminopeptidase N